DAADVGEQAQEVVNVGVLEVEIDLAAAVDLPAPLQLRDALLGDGAGRRAVGRDLWRRDLGGARARLRRAGRRRGVPGLGRLGLGLPGLGDALPLALGLPGPRLRPLLLCRRLLRGGAGPRRLRAIRL